MLADGIMLKIGKPHTMASKLAIQMTQLLVVVACVILHLCYASLTSKHIIFLFLHRMNGWRILCIIGRLGNLLLH